MKRIALILFCACVLAGCGGDRARHAAVVGLPEAVDSADVTAVHQSGKLRVDVRLEIAKQDRARYAGKELVMLCRLARYDGEGHLTRGGNPHLAKDGHAKLVIDDAKFARSFWRDGGQCSLLVSGSSDLPMFASFGAS
jgi:hypothetical protein